MSCTNSPKTFSPSTSEDPVLRLAMAKAKARAKQSENFEYGLKTFTYRSTFINLLFWQNSCFKGKDPSPLYLCLAQTRQKTFSPSMMEDPVLRLATATAKARAKQSENFEYGPKTFTERNTIAYYLQNSLTG